METAATLQEAFVEKQSAFLVQMAEDIKLALPHLHKTAFDLFAIIGESGADKAEAIIDQMSAVFTSGEGGPVLNAFSVVAMCLVVMEDLAMLFGDADNVKDQVSKALRDKLRDPRQTVVN